MALAIIIIVAIFKVALRSVNSRVSMCMCLCVRMFDSLPRVAVVPYQYCCAMDVYV